MTGLPLVVALLLAGSPPAPAEPFQVVVPAGAQRAEIQLRFPPWQFTGTFRLVAAGLEDVGTVRDSGSLMGPQGDVERVLEGEKGTLRLVVRAQTRTSFPYIFGTWRVRSGTGAYARLAGGGTFTAADGGKKTGSPFEIQSLLGRVGPR